VAKLLKHGLNSTLVHFHNMYWIFKPGSHMSTLGNHRPACWKLEHERPRSEHDRRAAQHHSCGSSLLCRNARRHPPAGGDVKREGKLLPFQTSDRSHQRQSTTFSTPYRVSQDLYQLILTLTSKLKCTLQT